MRTRLAVWKERAKYKLSKLFMALAAMFAALSVAMINDNARKMIIDLLRKKVEYTKTKARNYWNTRGNSK